MSQLQEKRKNLMASLMREEIFAAAVAVLKEHGLDGMTMDRVAAKAKVGKASLYKYFDNKHEMVKFVHAKAIEPVMESVQAQVDGELPADEKLEAILRTWFGFLSENRGLMRLFFNDIAMEVLLQSQKDSTTQTAIENIGGIVREGIETGLFRRIDPTRVALLIFGATRELAERTLANGAEWPVDELTEEVMDFFLRGLRADS